MTGKQTEKDFCILVEEKETTLKMTNHIAVDWNESFSFYFFDKIYLMILTFILYFFFCFKCNSKLYITPLKVKTGIYFKMKKDNRFPITEVIIQQRCVVGDFWGKCFCASTPLDEGL